MLVPFVNGGSGGGGGGGSRQEAQLIKNPRKKTLVLVMTRHSVTFQNLICCVFLSCNQVLRIVHNRKIYPNQCTGCDFTVVHLL